MKDYYQESRMCIDVMQNRLRFVISDENLIMDGAIALEIHLQIDVNKQVFYNDFFNTIRTQMQLLEALNEEEESLQLLYRTKTDLSLSIQKETGCKRKLIFSIPKLDKVLV